MKHTVMLDTSILTNVRFISKFIDSHIFSNGFILISVVEDLEPTTETLGADLPRCTDIVKKHLGRV